MRLQLNSGTGLLLRQRRRSQVWLDGFEVGEELLSQVVVDRRMDNDIVACRYDLSACSKANAAAAVMIPTWNPVYRRGNSVLISCLERVYHTEDFGRIASGRGRIRHDETNGLLGINDEDASDGEGNAFLIDICGILVVQHIIKIGYLSLLIANDGEA